MAGRQGFEPQSSVPKTDVTTVAPTANKNFWWEQTVLPIRPHDSNFDFLTTRVTKLLKQTLYRLRAEI